MCLGVPARVVEVHGDTAKVDFGDGVLRLVDATCIDDLKPGEYVIVHAGIIIERIREEEYKEMTSLLREIMRAVESEGV